MSAQPATASFTVGNTLLEWSRGIAGIGGWDAYSMYLYSAQDLFRALLTGGGGFVRPVSEFDLGLADADGIELAGNTYSRSTIGFGPLLWSADVSANPIVLSNLAEIAFPAADGADWLETNQLLVCDHATGTVLQAALLGAPVTVTDGDNLTFAMGALQLLVQL